MKKKIIGLATLLLGFSMVANGSIEDEINQVSALLQQGNYGNAENTARNLLNNSEITPFQREIVLNLLNEIEKQKGNVVNNFKKETSQEEVNRLIEEAERKREESGDTGTTPAKEGEDISTELKFEDYSNYEEAILQKKNANTIYQMSQLYFRDGLYEKAVNMAKEDLSGDTRNLYVVAIGSRLMGNYDQSIDYYNRILAVSPGQAEARLGIGIAYKSKGEYSKALQYLKSYIKTRENKEVVREIQILNELISSK